MGKRVEIYGDGNYVRDYLYIDDLSECLFKCCQIKIKSGIYNVRSGKGTSVFEICKIIEKITDKDIYFIESEIGKEQVTNNILDCSKIENKIGWEPYTELQNRIKKILQTIQKWCRNNLDK